MYLGKASSSIKQLAAPFTAWGHTLILAVALFVCIMAVSNASTGKMLAWSKYARDCVRDANSGYYGTNPLKQIVIAAHHNENVSCLHEVSRHWLVTIVGPGGLPANKGNEAMAYLTYLIQNYDNLPESMAFIHSHEDGWHTSGSQLTTMLSIPCWESLAYTSITAAAHTGTFILLIRFQRAWQIHIRNPLSIHSRHCVSQRHGKGSPVG